MGLAVIHATELAMPPLSIHRDIQDCVVLFAFSCTFDFALRIAPSNGALTIDDLHKTDMWNWCSLGRLYLLLKLLFFFDIIRFTVRPPLPFQIAFRTAVKSSKY